jgi:DNA replication protein DnaC
MLTQQTVEKLHHMKLHGMAEALHSQLEQPHTHELAFEERISLLVDYQWTYRENKVLKRRLKAAKLKQDACIEDIDYRHPRGLDRSVIQSLASSDWIRYHQTLLITGPTGAGKTFLACAFGNQACRDGFTAFYIRAPRLFLHLTMAKADGSFIKFMNKLAKNNLLIIDDWGLAPLTDGERRDLLEVLEDRQTTGSTLISSQLPIEHWHEHIGDPTLADAILDRLIHRAHKIQLKGPSMRKLKSDLTHGSHVIK